MTLNLCKPFGMHNILQQQTPQFRCTLREQIFFCWFVLNLLIVPFDALLSQTRRDNDHLDPICSLKVTHHFVDLLVFPISRLSQTVESLGLQSLLMWNLPCFSFCYQLLRSGKLWYLFCSVLYSIFIIPNTYLLFYNHHRALHLHFHKNTHNYSISFLTG